MLQKYKSYRNNTQKPRQVAKSQFFYGTNINEKSTRDQKLSQSNNRVQIGTQSRNIIMLLELPIPRKSIKNYNTCNPNINDDRDCFLKFNFRISEAKCK